MSPSGENFKSQITPTVNTSMKFDHINFSIMSSGNSRISKINHHLNKTDESDKNKKHHIQT